FGLRRMEDGPRTFTRQGLLRRGELENLDPFERPSVRSGDPLNLRPRFGEGDVHPLLAAGHSLNQVLEGQRGLANAGVALHEVQPLGRQSTAQEMIETRD